MLTGPGPRPGPAPPRIPPGTHLDSGAPYRGATGERISNAQEQDSQRDREARQGHRQRQAAPAADPYAAPHGGQVERGAPPSVRVRRDRAGRHQAGQEAARPLTVTDPATTRRVTTSR